MKPGELFDPSPTTVSEFCVKAAPAAVLRFVAHRPARHPDELLSCPAASRPPRRYKNSLNFPCPGVIVAAI